MSEDNVAPWKVDGRDSDGGFADSEHEEGGRGGTTLGMNDVTTATRNSEQIFRESRRILILLAARSKVYQRFTTGRDG